MPSTMTHAVSTAPAFLAAWACLAAVAAAPASAAAGPTPPHPSAATSVNRPEPTPLEAAIDAVSEATDCPARTRGTLLMRMGAWPTCYPDNLSKQEWEHILAATGLLAPADGPPGLQPRYYIEPNAWGGQALIQPANGAQRAMLTYSFPDDGTTWGLTASGFATGPNVLNQSLTTVFGSTERGREYIRQALAAWRGSVGVEYTEVADNNSAMDHITARQSVRGDIRIGGVALTTGAGILAYNAYPAGTGTNALSGGDMLINTSYFLPANLAATGSEYRYLRNTVTHEHGHGLGLRHTVPCDLTKLMEPQVGGQITGLQIDDLRGGARNYGDFYSGNNNGGNAASLGNLSTPAPRSLLLRNMSTNGSAGSTGSSEDWYTFTLSTPQTVTITMTPVGSTYMTAQQTSGCAGSGTVEINSLAAGNLLVQLRKPATTVLFESSGAAAGLPETINAGTLSAGTYFVRVRDHSANAVENQYVQLYDLLIGVGGMPSAPRAIAGVNKRVQADSPCWLMGHINSRATEPGATLLAADCAWDLDGDGVFELPGSPVTFTYPSNGSHSAVLRVTDSNGVSSTDSITVNVWGATTTVASISPPGGGQGSTVPVVITGTNFKGVTSSTQVTVSGTGVTVSGTPVVNHLGTQITGLSFVVAAGATQSVRNVSISNSDGLGAVGTGIGVFAVGTVAGACCTGTTCTITTQGQCGGTWTSGAACGTTGNPTTCCRANFNGINGLDVADIFDFLNAWFAGLPSANFNGAGGVTVEDIFAFLSAWFAGCAPV